MKNKNEVLNLKCREVPASTENQARTWAALLPLLCSAVGGGVAFDLWPGNVAMFALVAVAAVALLIGLQSRNGKRISGLFGLSAFVGLAGLTLSLADVNASLSVVGFGVAAFAILVLSKISLRGWEYV